MKLFRFIGRTLDELLRRIGQANQRRKLRVAKNENEAERIDRLRHPENYRGK